MRRHSSQDCSSSGRSRARVGKLQAAGAPEAGVRTLRLIMLSRLDLVLLFLIVYDMAVKPSFGDAESIGWGLVGALAVGGLVYWRYRSVTQSAPPSAST